MEDGVPTQYKILAEGFNFHPDGGACEFVQDGKLHTYPEVIHAEISALQDYDIHVEKLMVGKTIMFITHQPCNNCATAIMAAGFNLKDIEVVKEMTGNATDMEAVLAERGSNYGKFEDQATIVQNLKNTMHKSPQWNNLDNDQKEALEMVQHKIARILNGNPNHKDSWDDIVGYTKLVADRL